MDTLPMLLIPFKTTTSIDFTHGLKAHIRNVYQNDPDQFGEAISTLNRYRTAIEDIAGDMRSRDDLFRYFGQLELLELRFPINENAIRLGFTWNDAFTDENVEQDSISFEKSAVLYNLAAVLSAFAQHQNLSDVNGLKGAFNYYQAAAGYFKYVGDNFLHSPSVDTSRDMVSMLEELVLAQAQECFVQKALLENKKGNLISKLSKHLSFSYSAILESLVKATLSGKVPSSWADFAKIKAKYYQALAYYHKALYCEAESRYGDVVAFATLADTACKELVKLAYSHRFVSEISSPTAILKQVLGGADESPLYKAAQALAEASVKLKAKSIKDNDVIYHEKIPSLETCAESGVEPLKAVKYLKLADLYPKGDEDIKKIIGFDLFQKLVPMEIHQLSSLYSQEKDDLLRNTKESILVADQEVQAVVSSLNLREITSKMKAENDEYTLPADIMDSLRILQSEEGRITSRNFIKKISELRSTVSHGIDKINFDLHEEQRICESNRSIYQAKWTLDISLNASKGIQSQLSGLSQSFQVAVSSDRSNEINYQKIEHFIPKCLQPLDLILQEYRQTLNPIETTPRKSSLLDDDFAGDSQEKSSLVEKIEASISTLDQLKKDRLKLLEELRSTLASDDITQMLVFNRGMEQQVFDQGKAKYLGIKEKIQHNLNNHRNEISKLGKYSDSLKSTSSYKKLLVSGSKQKALDEEFRTNLSSILSLRHEFENASRFYGDAINLVNRLSVETGEFIAKRSAETIMLKEKIEYSQSNLTVNHHSTAGNVSYGNLQPPSNYNSQFNSYGAVANAPTVTYQPTYGQPYFPSQPYGPQHQTLNPTFPNASALHQQQVFSTPPNQSTSAPIYHQAPGYPSNVPIHNQAPGMINPNIHHNPGVPQVASFQQIPTSAQADKSKPQFQGLLD